MADPIDPLRQALSKPDVNVADVRWELRVLLHVGFSRADLRVLIERDRVKNDMTSNDETFEENAILALDLLEDRLPSWRLEKEED